MAVRPFKIEDLEPIVALQNLCMPRDSVTSLVFQRKVLLDPNMDLRGCLVAEEAGKQVGFILGLRRKFQIEDAPDDSDRSWITLFFVHPDFRGRGIGSALLSQCEDFLNSDGRKTCWISSYAPNYFIPGVDIVEHATAHQFLLKRGYTEFVRPLAMDGNLVPLEWPEWLLQKKKEREAEGYTFEYFTPKRTFAVMDHMLKCFPGDWQRFAREKMIGITFGRNMPDELALAVKDDEEVHGFAMHDADRFGPFGVDSTLRGGGLGAVVYFMILERMRAKGIHNAWFLWTDDKTAKLYSVAGLRETRRFALLKKVF